MVNPVADGIAAADLLAALQSVLRERNCVGFEIVEFDPERSGGITARLVLARRTRYRGPTPPPCAAGRRARRLQLCPAGGAGAGRRGAGCSDVDGQRYLDFRSAYSATSFGHGHPGYWLR